MPGAGKVKAKCLARCSLLECTGSECHAEANCQATVIPESHRLGPV